MAKLTQYIRQLNYSADLWREYWHMLGSCRGCDKRNRGSTDKLQLVQILLDCRARGDDLEWQSRVGGQHNSGGLNHHDDGNGTDCGGDNDDAVGIMGSGSQDVGMANFTATGICEVLTRWHLRRARQRRRRARSPKPWRQSPNPRQTPV